MHCCSRSDGNINCLNKLHFIHFYYYVFSISTVWCCTCTTQLDFGNRSTHHERKVFYTSNFHSPRPNPMYPHRQWLSNILIHNTWYTKVALFVFDWKLFQDTTFQGHWMEWRKTFSKNKNRHIVVSVSGVISHFMLVKLCSSRINNSTGTDISWGYQLSDQRLHIKTLIYKLCTKGMLDLFFFNYDVKKPVKVNSGWTFRDRYGCRLFSWKSSLPDANVQYPVNMVGLRWLFNEW